MHDGYTCTCDGCAKGYGPEAVTTPAEWESLGCNWIDDDDECNCHDQATCEGAGFTWALEWRECDTSDRDDLDNEASCQAIGCAWETTAVKCDNYYAAFNTDGVAGVTHADFLASPNCGDRYVPRQCVQEEWDEYLAPIDLDGDDTVSHCEFIAGCFTFWHEDAAPYDPTVQCTGTCYSGRSTIFTIPSDEATKVAAAAGSGVESHKHVVKALAEVEPGKDAILVKVSEEEMADGLIDRQKHTT